MADHGKHMPECPGHRPKDGSCMLKGAPGPMKMPAMTGGKKK